MNHEEVRFGAVWANGEGAVGILRDAALRDVGRLAVAQRADPEIERDLRPRRSQPHTHAAADFGDRKSTRLNSSHGYISYAVFCLKKKKHTIPIRQPSYDVYSTIT